MRSTDSFGLVSFTPVGCDSRGWFLGRLSRQVFSPEGRCFNETSVGGSDRFMAELSEIISEL